MNISLNATTPDFVLWLALAAFLTVLYYFKQSYVVRAAHWMRALIEEDGKPSLRRSAFAFALVAVVTVLGLACAWPRIITDQAVKAIEQVFLFVGGIYVARGSIEDVADLIRRRGGGAADPAGGPPQKDD